MPLLTANLRVPRLPSLNRTASPPVGALKECRYQLPASEFSMARMRRKLFSALIGTELVLGGPELVNPLLLAIAGQTRRPQQMPDQQAPDQQAT